LGKKGKTARLKRNPAPKFWPIHRKEFAWVVKPSSGPHTLEKSLSLTLVLRDILGLAKTKKEAGMILSQGRLSVDGRIRKKADFPVGLMDVIAMPDADQYFRVMPSQKGLVLARIDKSESGFKLARVENKNSVKGAVQIALHDGSNILARTADPKNPAAASYNTFDVLKVSLPEKEVLSKLTTKIGNLAIITGGKNIGKKGKIVEIEKTEAKKRKNALVVVEAESGIKYQTILGFIFSIGDVKPMITEASASV
jgi:small subunit ribosomal protein S4e